MAGKHSRRGGRSRRATMETQGAAIAAREAQRAAVGSEDSQRCHRSRGCTVAARPGWPWTLRPYIRGCTEAVPGQYRCVQAEGDVGEAQQEGRQEQEGGWARSRRIKSESYSLPIAIYTPPPGP